MKKKIIPAISRNFSLSAMNDYVSDSPGWVNLLSLINDGKIISKKLGGGRVPPVPPGITALFQCKYLGTV
jgi:hypothetical protein